MMESKKEIYDLIPPKFYPKTELIKEGTSFETLKELIRNIGLKFPLIAKPDIGLRGSAVKKINDLDELKEYVLKANFDFILQDLIPYKNEIGVFYVRYPNECNGRITGIVSKEFMIVNGNGVSTIAELIKGNPRFELQLDSLWKEHGATLLQVLSQGESLNLVPYGNHARGAKFIDASHWVTPKLEQTINDMCLQIPGFFFGRLDLMYETLEDLEQGQKFSIVELNGASSEPTHIYDPKHSLFFAWKELSRHISLMYKISVINKKNGVSFLSYSEGIKEYRKHLMQSNKIMNF